MPFARDFFDYWYQDLVDQDPTCNVLEEDLDLINKDYTHETPPDFDPTPYDVVFETSWWEDRTLALYFSRGLETLNVYMEGLGLKYRNHPLVPGIGPEDVRAQLLRENAQTALEELHAIKICSEFIHALDFARTGLVFVRKDPVSGIWRHITKRAPTFELFQTKDCPFHIVDEHEIRLTRMHGTNMQGYNEGIWRGIPVEVLRPRTSVECWKFRLDIMNVLRLQHYGLPYHYNYLAAIRRDNKLIGVICEARTGRVVRSWDRDKVYQAIMDIERIGFIHMEVNEQQFAMTHTGEVRVLLPHRMLHREMTNHTEEEWRHLVQRRHDEALVVMFERLRIHERHGKGGWGYLSRYQKQLSFIVPHETSPLLHLLTWNQWPSDLPDGEELLTNLMDEMRISTRKGKKKKQRLIHPSSNSPEGSEVANMDLSRARGSAQRALIRSGLRGARGTAAAESANANHTTTDLHSDDTSSSSLSLSDILATAGYSPPPSSHSSLSGKSSWSLVERASSEARSSKSQDSTSSSWTRPSSVGIPSSVSHGSDAWEEVDRYSDSAASTTYSSGSVNTQSSSYSFIEG